MPPGGTHLVDQYVQGSVSYRAWCTPVRYTDAVRLEAQMVELRQQQKQLLALLADKGVTPQGLEDGMLRAMLYLKG